MMWRSTTKVAFGIEGRNVIAWYCDEKGNSPSAPTNANVFKANVGEACLVFDSASSDPESQRTRVYNKCYNDRQRKQHNDKRALHEARDLEFNEEASIQIQMMLNAMTRGDRVEMPTSSERPAEFRTCGENIFTGTNYVNAFTTNAATADWYAGWTDYDFAEHQPKSDAVQDNSDEFT